METDIERGDGKEDGDQEEKMEIGERKMEMRDRKTEMGERKMKKGKRIWRWWTARW